MFDILPDELLPAIVYHLKCLHSLCIASRICSRFRRETQVQEKRFLLACSERLIRTLMSPETIRPSIRPRPRSGAWLVSAMTNTWRFDMQDCENNMCSICVRCPELHPPGVGTLGRDTIREEPCTHFGRLTHGRLGTDQMTQTITKATRNTQSIPVAILVSYARAGLMTDDKEGLGFVQLTVCVVELSRLSTSTSSTCNWWDVVVPTSPSSVKWLHTWFSDASSTLRDTYKERQKLFHDAALSQSTQSSRDVETSKSTI